MHEIGRKHHADKKIRIGAPFVIRVPSALPTQLLPTLLVKEKQKSFDLILRNI